MRGSWCPEPYDLHEKVTDTTEPMSRGRTFCLGYIPGADDTKCRGSPCSLSRWYTKVATTSCGLSVLLSARQTSARSRSADFTLLLSALGHMRFSRLCWVCLSVHALATVNIGENIQMLTTRVSTSADLKRIFVEPTLSIENI